MGCSQKWGVVVCHHVSLCDGGGNGAQRPCWVQPQWHYASLRKYYLDQVPGVISADTFPASAPLAMGGVLQGGLRIVRGRSVAVQSSFQRRRGRGLGHAIRSCQFRRNKRIHAQGEAAMQQQRSKSELTMTAQADRRFGRTLRRRTTSRPAFRVHRDAHEACKTLVTRLAHGVARDHASTVGARRATNTINFFRMRCRWRRGEVRGCKGGHGGRALGASRIDGICVSPSHSPSGYKRIHSLAP